jgi:tetratricopeptide (TPR) repeat protein
MSQASKVDPIKTHRDGTALYDSGNYKEALDKFLQASQLYRKVGDIKKLVGEYDEGIRYWNEAIGLWKQLGERETEAALHRKMANVLWSNLGNREVAREHHGNALKILEAETAGVELARLYEDIAGMICMGASGNLTEARSWAEKAVELAKQLNAFDVIARSYASLGEILGMLGERRKAAECMDKALKMALDNGYTDTALWVYNDTGFLPAEEHEKHLEYLEKGFELAKKVGDPSWISWIGTNLAYCYTEMGDVNKAVPVLEETVALDKKAGYITHLPFSLDALGWAHLLLGEWSKSEQCYNEALSVSQKLDDYQAIMSAFGHLGWFHFDKGEYVKAKEFLEKMYQVAERHGAKSYQIGLSRFVVPVYLEIGEIEKARDLIDDIQEYALEKENKNLVAIADGLGAMQLHAEKKWTESIELFEKSLQEFETLNARRWNVYWLARMVFCEYAKVYLERNQEGDREKARKILNEALEIFQKSGARKEIERTMKLVEALQRPLTQIPEETVSPESPEYAEVQSNIIATPRELKIGESLELEIELTNTRKKGAILLTKITEVIPEGFTMVKKPELYRMEGNCLNMKEKRLGPLKTEEITFVLTPRIQGTFRIKPRILYIDASGKEKTLEPKPTSITVKELGIKGWLKGER